MHSRTAAPASSLTIPRTPAERLTPEDLDLKRRTLAVARVVVARPEVRQRLRGIGLQQRLHTLLRRDGCRGLERAGEEIIDLRNAGATEQEVRQYVVMLDELVRDLFSGKDAPRAEDLELPEQEADAAEDVLQIRAMTSGPRSPAVERELARAYRHYATIATSKAWAHEREARRLERERRTA
ncbi:MAG TPA: hypothetical protein VFN76_10150 [Candidatus Limnocylindria bacterium]|nr:hypothetical protein [Candidatus Limnocylindria bacterium]